METEILALACPACGKTESAHLWEKDGYRIARCNFCRTLFVENPPQDTSAIYDEGYFFGAEGKGGYMDYDREKDAMRRTFAESLDRIGKAHPEKGEMLDVGAATGYFLALARERGWNVRGVDVSAAAAAAARNKNVDVFAGTLAQAHFPAASFDAITAFDVIEHVPEPAALAREMHTLMRDGAVLFGSTPDSSSLNARLSGKRWHMLFPPEHLVLMNERALRSLFERTGFEVLWIGKITKRFTPQYIFQTAARWLGTPMLSKLARLVERSPLSRISIPLDLRDNIFFLARKMD